MAIQKDSSSGYSVILSRSSAHYEDKGARNKGSLNQSI